MGKFQHTATRRWLPIFISDRTDFTRFNTQPPEGGCHFALHHWSSIIVSTHSHPKVAAAATDLSLMIDDVSTHSHPKVAALGHITPDCDVVCFNTQPPEGGCFIWISTQGFHLLFQHTATRRWLLLLFCF